MRIGLSFWGFLGPGVLNTPDGGRFWRRPIVDELVALGHDIVLLQNDRDRLEAGDTLPFQWHDAFPPIDALFCEWRWPLPGRNTTPCGADGHTCDLHRQADLIEQYAIASATPTVIWDTDRQLHADDPLHDRHNVIVCEPGLAPPAGVTSLVHPVPDKRLDTAHPQALAAIHRTLPLAYVGNQYNRDDEFDRFFAPAATRFRHRVAGKWTRTDRWPHVNFTGRCPFPEVQRIHQSALATVLLNPARYSGVGHVSQRLFESTLAGCLPITPAVAACRRRPRRHRSHRMGARHRRQQRTRRPDRGVPFPPGAVPTVDLGGPPSATHGISQPHDGSRVAMYPPQFATFHDAYRAVLGQLHQHSQFETESRGNRSRECMNVAFTLTDPRHRTPYVAARRANIAFNYAETLWYLSGRDDLAMIGHYASRLHALSADGERLTGTAYGPRLFAPIGSTGHSQWDQTVELLRHDPDSKRAAMVVMRPGEAARFDNPDVACTLALQFLLRDGHLHMVATMRGNDAMVGLLCDVFAFTFIHEFTAVQLGVKLGSYTHQVSSMHVNESDLSRVNAILTEHQPPSFSPVAMPVETSRRTIEHVLRWEEDLRTGRRRFRPDADALGGHDALSSYWRQVVLLFEVHRQVIHQPGELIEPAVVDALTPAHRWLVAHRWPDRLPGSAPAAVLAE